MYAAPYTGQGSRTEHAYRALKRGLLAGELGLGIRLAEERLAAELDISRTPVREALSRLHAEGLVERHPQGGFAPAAPDLHLTRQLYEVRFALEREALMRTTRDGAELRDVDDLVALRGEWSSFEAPPVDDDVNPDFALLDEEFHVRLAASSGNRALAETLSRVNERIRPVRMHDFVTTERIDATIDQHIGVLDAVIDGREHAALERLDDHFAESFAVVEQRAAAALARMWALAREADS
mgnify:CR=1 FL=1